MVWLVERDRPAVRFHAMQSMLAFGTSFLAWATLWGGSFLVLVSSATGFFLLQRLAQLVLVAGFIVWAVCLWQVSAAWISGCPSSATGRRELTVARSHLAVPVFRFRADRSEDLHVPLAAAPWLDDLGGDDVDQDLGERPALRDRPRGDTRPRPS